MELKEITLLSEEEYMQYKFLIPPLKDWWWLKTPSMVTDFVRVVQPNGDISHKSCYGHCGGVRPVLKFDLEMADPLFWHKTESLIGSKIKYGRCEWVVLDVENNEIYALCNYLLEEKHFDDCDNIWEKSKLKNWLETDTIEYIERLQKAFGEI